MKVSVEVSLYPLSGEYLSVIEDFIARLNDHRGIRVVTNCMSTQLFGDYQQVLQVVAQEMQRTHQQLPQAAFAMKVLGSDLQPND